MASTGVDRSPPVYASDQEKASAAASEGKDGSLMGDLGPRASISASLSGSSQHDSTHRKLKSRHIQLIGIGGTIGTVLYVREKLLFGLSLSARPLPPCWC